MSFSFLKIAFKIQDRKIVCVVKNGCRKNTLFWGDILSSGKKKKEECHSKTIFFYLHLISHGMIF